MATTKIGKKDLQQDEFLENMFDLGEWLEVHWKRVAAAVGGIILVVLLVFGWIDMRDRANDEANRLLGQGLDAYDPQPGADGKAAEPRYAAALPFFEQAAAKGGTGTVGEIARFYKGRTLLAMGRAAEAVPILEAAASSSNATVGTQAKVSLAQALQASGNPDRAATILTELASSTGGIYPPAAAALALADLRAGQGKKAEARKAYEDLLAKFPDSPYASTARTRIGALGS